MEVTEEVNAELVCFLTRGSETYDYWLCKCGEYVEYSVDTCRNCGQK